MNSSQQSTTKRINHNQWKCHLIGQAICYPEWSAKPLQSFILHLQVSLLGTIEPEFHDLNIRVIQNTDGLAFY